MSDFEIPDFEILGPADPGPKIEEVRPRPLVANYELRRLVEATISSVYGYGWASDAAVERVISAITMVYFRNTRFQRDVATQGSAYALRRWVIENQAIVKGRTR